MAVAWGSKVLQAVADQVLDGSSPADVAPFIVQAFASGQIPSPRVGRRKTILGYSPTGSAVSLPMLGRNVLVAGDPRSGKAWIAGLLAERPFTAITVQDICERAMVHRTTVYKHYADKYDLL